MTDEQRNLLKLMADGAGWFAVWRAALKSIE